MATNLRLPPMPPLSHVLKLYNVRAKKQLAQNFIFDPKILARIASYIGPKMPETHVCEIGPGPGGITRQLLEKGAKTLSVVEKDRRFIPSLQMLCDTSQGRMKVHHADILQFNKSDAFPEVEPQEWTENELPNLYFIGNLPFNVSLPLLFQLLKDISHRGDVFHLGRIPMIFTFQQEVAERLLAMPGEKQRCRLSITAQYLCNVKYCFMIKGGSFIPAPKVDVGVIKLSPKKNFEIDLPFETVDHVVKHVFHFRQKYCINGIRSLFPPKRDDLVDEIVRNAGINPKERPYNLYMGHFGDLCYSYHEIAHTIPQIAKVDTYGSKEWLKYFDENGDPLPDDEVMASVG